MSEETIKNLQDWAKKNERMEFERDLLILKARNDGDKMAHIARAAGMSRSHLYRIADECEAFFALAQEEYESDEAIWEAAKKVSTWHELLHN